MLLWIYICCLDSVAFQYYLSDRHLSKDIKTTKKFNALYIPSLYLAPLLSLYIPTTAFHIHMKMTLYYQMCKPLMRNNLLRGKRSLNKIMVLIQMTSDDMPTVTLDAITVNVRGIEEDEFKDPLCASYD